MFGDEDEEGDLGPKVPYDYYDDPFDILRMMLNYVDNDAGTCLHLATKVWISPDNVRSGQIKMFLASQQK